ncbi:MAG: hypothetical protein KA746_06525 [Pyrinomonadaceae bacterium]|nr:hypothetical protein [Pyrinomonadaceae bacterium]
MPNNEIKEMMDMLYTQARMRFGAAIKGRWFYDADDCPGCGKKIGSMKYKGKDAMSLNSFIFRDHGVLIIYLLCGKCGNKVIRATSDTPLHAEIEKNLKSGFIKQLGH